MLACYNEAVRVDTVAVDLVREDHLDGRIRCETFSAPSGGEWSTTVIRGLRVSLQETIDRPRIIAQRERPNLRDVKVFIFINL